VAACGDPQWNVLLLTLDTTRADFLGCYGKESARTPHLDQLAASGVLFDNACTSNPVTQPSHATILTGTYPLVHGVRDNGLFHLPEERTTLAELLASRGYATGAAIGGFPLTREFGTAQGFQFYDDDLKAIRHDLRGRQVRPRFPTWYDERPAAHVNDAIRPWLRDQAGRPFFVWLHYWDPHEPHIAPPPYSQLFAHDPYQGEIAYADDCLGSILRDLEEMGERERTLIVVVGDHGEGRSEHNEMTHAFLAYETTLHVPFLLWIPGLDSGLRVAEQVGTVDIVPTVLDLLGFEIPPDIQGRSLQPLIAARPHRGAPRTYYAESLSPRLTHGFGELRVLYQGPWKYIHGPRPELFNLAADRVELDDLAAQQPAKRQQLEAELKGFLREHASTETATAVFDAGEETRQRLAALGYLSTTDEELSTMTEELRSDGAVPQDHVGDINLVSRLRRELTNRRFELALLTATRLLEQMPDNGYYRAALAAAYLGLDRVDDAARVVDQTTTISASNRRQFELVAQALLGDGQVERSLTMARRLVDAEETADGLALQAHLIRASSHDRQDSLLWRQEFLHATERALELEPTHRTARLELVQQLLEDNDLERAEMELSQLLTSYPIDAQCQLAYAQLLRAEGRSRDALKQLERTLRIAPTLCEAHEEHLAVLVECGETERATQALVMLQKNCQHNQDLLMKATDLVRRAQPNDLNRGDPR